MKRLHTRLDRAGLLAATLLLAGCDHESSTNVRRYVALVHPLSLTFQGPTIGISAEADLRVDWTVLIESVPSDPGMPPARHRRTFDDQTLIAFAWDRTHNVGVVNFTPGDSCVASVSYPQLDPTAEGVRVSFRLP